MKKILFTLLTFNACAIMAFSQTGPAGVGNASGSDGQPVNSIWLKADAIKNATDGATISSWEDLSGNNFDAGLGTVTPGPVYKANGIGGKPTLNFGDGDGNYALFVPDNDKLDAIDEITVMVVFKRNVVATDFAHFIDKKQEDNGSFQESWGLEYNNLQNLQFRMTNNDTKEIVRILGSTFITNTEQAYISTTIWNGAYLFMFMNGGFDGLAEFAGTAQNSTKSFRISKDEKSDVAEIIIYQNGINIVQRTLIENYLAAKYNIALHERDLNSLDTLVLDATFYDKEGFKNDIIGIGKMQNPLLLEVQEHTKAQAGVLTIESAGLTEGELIMIGHDGTKINPSSPNNWDRVWYVKSSKENSPAIFTFDFAAVPTINPDVPGDFKLWYKGESGSYSAVEASATLVETSKLQFNLTEVASGYYRLGKDAPSSVNELNLSALEIYPNPAQDFINLKNGNLLIGTSAFVYDISGKKVLSTVLNNSNQIDISSLSSGIYTLKIEGKDAPTVYRFVKN